MIYDGLIEQFIMFIDSHYPEPKGYWTDIHYTKRSFERFALERVVMKCLDNPFTNPIYILENEILYWQELTTDSTNDTQKSMFKYICNALNALWNIAN